MMFVNRASSLGFIFALLILSACSSSRNLSNESAEDNEVSQSDLHTALIQPSDLDSGWVTDTYLYEYRTQEDYGTELPAMLYVHATMQVEPFESDSRRFGPVKSQLGLSQGIAVYEDEPTAIAEFEIIKDGETTVIWREVETSFQPQMDIHLLGCSSVYQAELGDFLSCQIVARHKQFITWGGMLVEHNKITLEDWEDFIIVIQERLLEYAG